MRYLQLLTYPYRRAALAIVAIICVVGASLGGVAVRQHGARAQANSGTTLYGIGSYYDQTSNQFDEFLASIDPTTGAVTQVGGTFGIQGIASAALAYDPAHQRYFLVGYAPSTGFNSLDLFTVDATTNTLLASPPITLPAALSTAGVEMLFYDQATSTLFGLGDNYDQTSNQSEEFLVSLDPTTGVATQVGRTFANVGLASAALAYDPAHQRYFLVGYAPSTGFNSLDLFTVDATTNTLLASPPITLPAALSTLGAEGVGELFYDPATSTLLGLGSYYDQTSNQSEEFLASIDPTSGVASQVGGTFANAGTAAFAMAYDATTNRYFIPGYAPSTGFNSLDLFTVDATTNTLLASPPITLPAALSTGGIYELFVAQSPLPTVSPPTAPQSATTSLASAVSLGSFSEAGGNGPWAIDVDWGDGSPHTTFSASAQGSLGTRTHTYTSADTDTITVVVQDASGDTGSAQFPAFVTVTGASVSQAASGTSSSPSGTATSTLGSEATTLSASATGRGTVTIAQYSANPAPTMPPNAVNAYFDVYLAPGNSFTAAHVVDCNLSSGDVVYWWNGSSWVQATPQTYDPTRGCVTLSLSSVTSPSVSALGGTYFGVEMAAKGANCSLSSYPTINGAYNLGDANLAGCNLGGAQLTQTNLHNSTLAMAYLGGAQLSAANLKDANLSGVTLADANLSSASLKDANLTGANLTAASLENADLQGANLHGTIITEVTWGNTVCPDGSNSNNDGGTCNSHV